MSVSAPAGRSDASSATSAPDLAAFLPRITTLLDTLTSQAATLPLKSDLAFHRTLDRSFARGLDGTSERVLALTERLLSLVEAANIGTTGKGKGRELSKSAPGIDAVVAKRSGTKATNGVRRKLLEEEDVVDGYRRGVVQVVDGLLEDADSKLDELNGEKRKAAITVAPHAEATAGDKYPGPPSWNSKRHPVRLPPHLLSADIPRPQDTWPENIDNSTTAPPWRPTLASKPHAMVPLDFEPSLEDASAGEPSDPGVTARRAIETRQRRHPYWYETQHLPYPTSMFTYSPPVAPASFEDTPFTFVDTPEALDAMVEKLRAAKEIAVDVEHHSLRSYAGFTCLVQISTREEDWVVDTLALRSQLREGKLGGVLVDPNIVKIFHGAESDIVWLQQDFDIFVVNLFDTYHATMVLGFPSHSLASLLSRYCDFSADKRYQMADWRIRPLEPEMLHYARADTHFLLYIYDNLRNALLDKSSRQPSPVKDGPETSEIVAPTETAESNDVVSGSEWRLNPQRAMREVLDRSADTALRLYGRKRYNEEDGRGTDGWKAALRRWLPFSDPNSEEVVVFKRLHKWRDARGRMDDEGIYYVMPNETLKGLAVMSPVTAGFVRKILETKPMPASKHVEEILGIMVNARKEAATSRAQSGAVDLARITEPTSAIPLKTLREEAPSLASSGPTPSSALPAASAQQPPRHVMPIDDGVEDIWDQAKSRTTPPAQRSNLFGSTNIAGNARPVIASPGPPSSLFGKTISTTASSRSQAGTTPSGAEFNSVLHAIFSEIREIKMGLGLPGSSAFAPVVEPSQDVRRLPDPETVPFKPATARTTINFAGEALPVSFVKQKADVPDGVSRSDTALTAKSSLPVRDQVIPPVPQGDVIVDVRRKKGKKRDPSDAEPVDMPRRARKKKTHAGDATRIDDIQTARLAAVANDPAPPIGSNASPVPAPQAESALPDAPDSAEALASQTPKKPRKHKSGIKPEDIPEFDYSAAGNLLDNPGLAVDAVGDEGGRKRKKDKKDRVKRAGPPPLVIETPRFGKSAPKEMSQPKGGNRSGTFVG